MTDRVYPTDVTHTDERTFDWIPRFDEKSRGYSIVVPAGEPPSAISFKTWDIPVWLDQGQEGACTGFGATHRAAGIGLQVTQDEAFALYRRAKQLDEWEGEDYSGSSVLAATKAAIEKGWVRDYWWAFNERQLAWGISSMGPAVIGVWWYEGMTRTDDNGFVTPSGNRVGGHCVCVYGYEYPGVYRIRNSWGRSWGIDGDCLISSADMAELIRQGAEVCHPTPLIEGK